MMGKVGLKKDESLPDPKSETSLPLRPPTSFADSFDSSE
jgi:hypothetical protein